DSHDSPLEMETARARPPRSLRNLPRAFVMIGAMRDGVCRLSFAAAHAAVFGGHLHSRRCGPRATCDFGADTLALGSPGPPGENGLVPLEWVMPRRVAVHPSTLGHGAEYE